jgi:Tfp pilus assembly protein PilX
MTALLLVTAITAGMIILSTTETNISSNFRDEQTAYFSAKAGIEEARDRLRTNATDTLRTGTILPTTLPAAGNANGVLYILNPAASDTVAPWSGNTAQFADDEICKEGVTIGCSSNMPPTSGWYSTIAASTSYAVNPVLAWKWTRITLKQNNSIAPYYTNGVATSAVQVCWNGNNEETTSCVKPNHPVYVLTTLAVTPSGSRRMIQAEVAEDQINFQAPAALTLDGAGDTFNGGNSSNFTVSGIDQGGCGAAASGVNVPAVGVTDAPDIGIVDSGIPKNRTGNYVGVDGSTPDVSNVSSTLPQNLQTVQSLQNLVADLKNDVTQPVINGPATNPSNMGTSSNPQIMYVNGDLTLTGNTVGNGILIVTGTLTAKGTTGWNGLVLVVGQGDAQIDGTTTWNGAMLLANTVTGQLGNLTLLGGNFGVSGGGNAQGGVFYSSGCLAQATQLSTFHVMALRELMR